MKYVISTNLAEHYIPVVFPEEVTHAFIAAALKKNKCIIHSAGFLYFQKGEWVVGKESSESLKLSPKEGDAEILNLFLATGIAGLELNNLLAYYRFQKKGKSS